MISKNNDTKILKSDLREIQIKDLSPGDEVVGFVTEPGRSNKAKFTTSKVLRVWKTKKPLFQIDLDNGMMVQCSGDHQWYTDRGWKYTTGKMNGIGQRPYLTKNNKIRVVVPRLYSSYEDTDDYRKGYLSGMIRGDGHIGIHGPYTWVHLRKDRNNKIYQRTGYSPQFVLRLKDREAILRTKVYLDYFGISTHDFRYTDTMTGIRTSKKADVIKIKDIIDWMDSEEYYRGFLAGIYDAEGSHSGVITRISNSNLDILSYIEKGLDTFNFSYVYDVPHQATNVIVRIIRLRGGLPEYVRFCQIINSAISRLRSVNNNMANGGPRVSKITDLGYEEDTWGLDTTTGSFIVNGMASRNCSEGPNQYTPQNILEAAHV